MKSVPALCWVLLAGLCSANAVQLHHSIILDPDVVVHWTPDNDTNTITIQLEARTRGWAAVGFSPAGGMTGADIVLAWVADGRAHLQDMHAVSNSAPILDKSNNVKLLDGYENSTHTVVTFQRPLRSCDKEHDLDLGVDTTRLIWALHPSDPGAGGPSYHGSRRGVRSVSLDGSGTFEFPTDSESFLIRNTDTEVLEESTHYHCEIHKMPDLGGKVHYTGYRVRLDPATARYVHHIVMYSCALPPSAHGVFENYVRSHPGSKCYSKNMPPSWTLCQSVFIVWAVGAEGDMLPDDVGMPLGTEFGGSTYFMLETHYDNPQVHKGVRDSSGLEVFYTRALRPVEAAVVTAGHMVSSTQIIPPGISDFVSGGVCAQDCTEKYLPEEGVQIHSVMLHGHLAARAIRVRHVRKGRELPPLIVDRFYDFNYQQSRRVDQSVRVLPGDTLLVECDYETKDRDKVTMGGFSTKNEMCLAFITYFPRTPLANCGSKPHVGDFLQAMEVPSVQLGNYTLPPITGAEYWTDAGFKLQAHIIEAVLNGSITEEGDRENNKRRGGGRDDWFNKAELSALRVYKDQDTATVTLYEYLTQLDWSRESIQHLQRLSNGGRVYHRCATDARHETKDYKDIFSGPHTYPEFEPWTDSGKH
ncbi:DBH-like monooxygenase protein 1 [Amphibalanus amphitrite]|uniref:DBH-like monooxygenase protein 1 n=1 Tax=Amphibalanus amphitrite TaxID=1232801 RepID=A0A6A4VL61_AMPAM|nr:DBH-like monooxygenase protein 1 [Amphibalanus amphitrite]